MLHSYSNAASISQHFPYLMCPYSITSIFCTHYVGWCTLSKNLMVLGFFCYKTSMCNRCPQFKAFSSYHVGMNMLAYLKLPLHHSSLIALCQECNVHFITILVALHLIMHITGFSIPKFFADM